MTTKRKRTAKRTRIHVVPKGKAWLVKVVGNGYASFDTQRDAIADAIQLAKEHEPASVYIHGKDGKVRDERSYGGDPYPPKG